MSLDTQIGNLGDIPDLSGVIDDTKGEPFADGWYKGTILEKREFTDKNGNDRVFSSEDEPARVGESRNIRLQVELKRADGKVMNLSTIVNYQSEDLSAATVQAVMAQKDKTKDGESWGDLFRPFMTLQRLGALQRIGGVNVLGRNGNGGLDLHPIFGKSGYFRIRPDKRNAMYKEIAEFTDKAPKSVR